MQKNLSNILKKMSIEFLLVSTPFSFADAQDDFYNSIVNDLSVYSHRYPDTTLFEREEQYNHPIKQEDNGIDLYVIDNFSDFNKLDDQVKNQLFSLEKRYIELRREMHLGEDNRKQLEDIFEKRNTVLEKHELSCQWSYLIYPEENYVVVMFDYSPQ
ncbi:hypothetical protein HQ529_05285 [Candidatus Woesearchaeota archaeon]|nr:hypothetical protein [Candidatus Woesearchaeota archaeon]